MNKNELLFSVILPVYNAEHTLSKTLRYLSEQISSNFEVCAVNDGSTDQSQQMLEQFQLESNFAVKVENQENSGVAAARNCAAALAEAPWLVFLDADDYWFPNKLQVLQKFIENQTKVGFWAHGMNRQSFNGNKTQMPPNALTWKSLLTEGNSLITSSVAVKKAYFLKVEGMNEKRNFSSAEDWDCWVQLLQKGVYYGAINQVLGYYLDQPAGLSKDLVKHRSACFNVLDKFKANGFLSPEEWQIAARQKSYEMARQAHKMKAYEKALSWYQDSDQTLKREVLELLARMGFAI